jgi:hypothetical protein
MLLTQSQSNPLSARHYHIEVHRPYFWPPASTITTVPLTLSDTPSHQELGISETHKSENKKRQREGDLGSRKKSQPDPETYESPKSDAKSTARFDIDPGPALKALRNADGHHYGSLPYARSIRLLEIEKGRGSAPVLAHLHLTRLETVCQDFPQGYEALSYVWGNQHDVSLHTHLNEDVELRLNGETVTQKIMPNLRKALRRVRLSNRSRVVWADAICINQDDEKERGHQVRLMREIYKNAKNVVVFLGSEEEKYPKEAFAVICNIVNSQPDNTVKANFRNAKGRVQNIRVPLEIPEPDSKLWESLQRFFDVDWFWRLWVVQEIALSSSAVVMWGNFEISWKWIGIASAHIRSSYYQILRRYSMEGLYNAYFMYRISVGELDLVPLSFSFLRLLGLTRQFEVSDPRDRVFGVLGLPTTDADPERGQLFMEPNYSLSAQDVNKELARRILDRDGNLQLLSSAGMATNVDGNGDETQPESWVPQWDTASTQALGTTDPHFNHSTSANVSMQRIERVDPKILAIRGLDADVITEVLPKMSDGRGPPIAHTILTGFSTSETFRTFLEAPDGRRSLCWTLTAGKDWYGLFVSDKSSHLADFTQFLLQFPTSRDLNRIDPKEGNPHDLSFTSKHDKRVAAWEQFVDDIGFGSTSSNGDPDRFLEAAMNVCIGRRIFITKSGCLGLGPAAMTTGDHVCVLYGGNVPFILRAKDEHFILIGECYVDTLMNGQAIERYKKGNLTEMIFEIH